MLEHDPQNRDLVIKPEKVKALLALIIIAAALLHLLAVNGPLADDHSWNQIVAAMNARHFLEEGFDWRHPQRDIFRPGMPGPRIEAEEAPIYQLIVAVLAYLFGHLIVMGRLVSIFFGAGATLYLFLLTRRKAGEAAGLFAAAFFAFGPYPFYFYRAIMTDGAMVFAVIAALYYFDRYCEKERWADLVLAAVMTALAGLFKPYAFFVGLPMIALSLKTFGRRMFAKPGLWVFALIALIPPLLWVRWAVNLGTIGGGSALSGILTGEPPLYGKWSLLIDPKWYYRMQWRLFDRMMTPIVPVLILAAIFLKEGRKKAGLFFWWLGGVTIYLLLVRQGNFVHSYYQMPFTAPFAALGGVGLAVVLNRLRGRARSITMKVLLVGFFVVALIYVMPHYKRDLSGEMAGALVAKHTAPSAKVLVIDPGDTRKNQVVWAAHRQGWHFQSLKIEDIQRYKELGASAAVFVLEPGQMQKNREAIEYLQGRNLLVAHATGDFGKRGEQHEILLFRLDGGS